MAQSRMYFEIDFAAGTGPKTPAYLRRYIWRIRRTGNREILASSEILNSHAACMVAITIVYEDAHKSGLHDKTKDA